MTRNITFREIERTLGIADEQRQPQESLEIWYASVRDRPIVDFNVEDLSRACRQVLYPNYVVPEAIKRLQGDPLAGEKYDGELLAALGGVPSDYWVKHVEQASALRGIIGSIDTTDAELTADIARLLARLQ